MKGFWGRLVVVALLLAPGPLFAQKGKPIVAIYQMDDLAHSGQAETFSAMVETAIESTGKFRVIERQHLGKLLGEQARAKSGLVTSNTPGKMGGFEGADYLIYGTITTISASRRQDLGASLMAGFLSGNRGSTPNCANTTATLGIDIKITDADSGEVKYVTRIDESQKSSASCAGDAQIDSASLLRSAADRVATGLVTTIYPIQVAAVQGDGTLVLNYGQGAVQQGATMAVFSKGAEIRDPATGEVIGSNEVKLGFVRVTEVNNRISMATPVAPFAAAPPVGSIVRPATTDEIAAMARAGKRR